MRWCSRAGMPDPFNHDPTRLVAYYMELQKQYQDRLIETEKTAERTDQSAD